MPVISPEQFTQLADRLAANYGLLIQAEKKYFAPPEASLYQQGQAYPARLLLDLTGTGTHVLLTARTTGDGGNYIYFSTVLPSAPNSALASNSFGTNLILSLATDENGKSITSVEEAVAFLKNTAAFTNFINITYPVSGVGGYVQPWPMLPLAGGVGTGVGAPPLFTLMTTQTGASGNDYTLTINLPTTANQAFDLCCTKNNLVIDLPTNASSAPTMTLGQLQTAIATATDDFVLLTSSPSTIAPAVSLTNFSGGSIGSYAQIVLTPHSGSTAADPDVVKGLVTPAQLLDDNFTAKNLEQGVAFLSNLQGAMANHFLTVGYSGGMAGFMTDNAILVHKNFSTLNNNRTGSTLKAANVFRPDQIVLGTVVQGVSALTFTPGTSLGNGDPTLNQTETNYGPQKLVAVLVPAGGAPLTANWSFKVNLSGANNAPLVSDTITFTAGVVTGAVAPITAGLDVRFFAVNGATVVAAGTNGDQAFITQVIERQVTL